MPAVSVITPTYNRPELLSQAIGSVLAQTWRDWEMLIIDDGSETSLRPVVASFADRRLRLIELEHRGRSIARNTGLKAACGQYIAFLDDDDLFHPHKLAHETAFLHEHAGIQVAGSGYRTLDRDGNVRKIYKPWLRKPELNQINCLYGFPSITCAVLISREAINQMDEWFDPVYDLGEDQDFFVRLILSGARFAWLKEVLSDYRYSHENPPTTLLDKHKIFREILMKIFHTSNLPPEIASQYQSVLVSNDLASAWHAYVYNLDKTAQYFLMLALAREPHLVKEQASVILQGLASYCRNNVLIDSPSQYLDHVMHHLPAPLQHLSERIQKIKESVLECEQ